MRCFVLKYIDVQGVCVSTGLQVDIFRNFHKHVDVEYFNRIHSEYSPGDQVGF